MINLKNFSITLSLILLYTVQLSVFANNPQNTIAQGISITGTVIDENGSPLPGVNIILIGTSNGTSSDVNGRYAINVPNENAVLQFSFVGFITSEVTVGSRKVVDVTLIENLQMIEEVVVVGYGTQRKSDVTGSISIVTSDDLLRTPSFSAISGLKGIASGVNVFINSGMPGGQQRVVIRGISSINAVADPLFVVDGVVMENFEFLNPNDIERMEVLKDASATAIYGARGSAGVILVTTKRGLKSEGAKVSYSGYLAFASLPKKMEVMNSSEFMQAWKIALQNGVNYGTKITESEATRLWTEISRNSAGYPQYYDLFKINGTFNPEGWKDLNDNSLEPLYDTNWQDEVMGQGAISHNHQLNIQQGGKNSSTGVFLNYTDQEGLLMNTYMKRINARLSHDSKPLKWLSTSVNLMVNHTWQNETPIGSGGLDAIRTMIEMPPIFPIKWPDGNWSNTNLGISGFSFEPLANPVHFLTVREQLWLRTQINGNVGLTLHLADGLDFRTQIGADGHLRNQKQYYPYGVTNQDNSGKGQALLNHYQSLYWQQTNYLNYNKVLDKHRINAMVGIEWSERVSYSASNNVGDFPTNVTGYNNIGSGAEQNSQSSSYSRWALMSYIGRFAYTYFDKYMVTLTAREDGSSRFGANNKFGFFPSLGLGWMVSNENFMKDFEWLDQLKLHTSYGVTGNNEIDPYRSLAVYTTGTILINSVRASSASPSRLANPDLRWERQKMYDAGFNLNMFGNRLNFDISWYYKYTDDLLLEAPIPYTSGFNSIFKNVGAISSRGWDILVNGTIVKKREFEWNAMLNANFNANKVEKLNEGNADMFVGDNWVNAQVIMRVGEPLGCWWGFERLGIHDGTDGRRGEALRTENKTILGKGTPDWMGSFINRLRYKNFDFSADIQFSIGGKIRQDFYHTTEDRFGYTSGLKTILTQSWREGDPFDQPNKVQAISNAPLDFASTMMDTRWLADASYLRGNLFQLGYTLSPKLVSDMHISALRAYLSVENLFLICSKDFQGYDPEASTRGRFEQNAFFFQYPRPRTFTVGLNLTF